MKKTLFFLMILALLPSLCLAETAASISIELPDGLLPIEGEALAGYEAAAQADFPDAARTVLAALSEDAAMAAVVFAVESELDGPAAAKEAAEKIIGSTQSVSEVEYGENTFGSFVCAVGELQFELFYIADSGTLYIIGTSGMEKADTEEMLAGISF